MRPSYRYALAAVIATALAVGLGAWLGTRPAAPPLERTRPPAEREAPSPASQAEAERDEMLDKIEATEAEKFGEGEAARRRRQREQLLDARVGEPE